MSLRDHSLFRLIESTQRKKKRTVPLYALKIELKYGTLVCHD